MVSLTDCSPTDVCVCSSNSVEMCSDLHVAAANQKFKMTQTSYEQVCHNCREENQIRDERMCKKFCKPCSKLPSDSGDELWVSCDFQKCVTCCRRCADCLVDCPIGDLYCKCGDFGSCDDQLVCSDSLCVPSRNPDKDTPDPGPPTTPAPTPVPTTPAPTREMSYDIIIFAGNYIQIIGTRKAQFLKEFNNALHTDMGMEDILAFDVAPGSIIVSFKGYFTSLNILRHRLKTENLVLPSFPKFVASEKGGIHGKIPTYHPETKKKHIYIPVIIGISVVILILVCALVIFKRRKLSMRRVISAMEGQIQMSDCDETNITETFDFRT